MNLEWVIGNWWEIFVGETDAQCDAKDCGSDVRLLLPFLHGTLITHQQTDTQTDTQYSPPTIFSLNI